MYTRLEAVREVDFEYGRGGRRYERSLCQRRRGGEGRGEAWMVLQSSSTKTMEITFGVLCKKPSLFLLPSTRK